MDSRPPDAARDAAAAATSALSTERVGLHALRDVQVEVSIEIGRKRMRIADVLRLATGNTVELAKAAGEPVDVYVNGQLLGRGEAIVVSDRYGVRITELVAREPGGTS
jgi:flagellar motor switch protein FliN/FliY